MRSAGTTSRHSGGATSWPCGTQERTVRRSRRRTTAGRNRRRCSSSAMERHDSSAGAGPWRGWADWARGTLAAMNARQRFHERLRRGPVLLDGAMGTLLYASGVHQRACLDELPTTRPDLVGAIHRAYLDAGAEVIETASFGANRARLAAF